MAFINLRYGIADLPRPLQWGVLLVLSLVFATLLELAGIPAALLLGPLLAGIIVGTTGGATRVPRPIYLSAQAIVGCLIASVISADIARTFLADWPLFLAVVVAVIMASGEPPSGARRRAPPPP